MILNGRNVTFAEMKKIRSPPEKKLHEDRFILSSAKCNPIILVSRNMKYMRIFAGDPRGGAVIFKRQLRPLF